MKNGKREYFIVHLIALGIMLFVLFINRTINDASQDDERNVLFISSYTESFVTVPDQIKGLQNTFDNSVNLEIEYMDTKRYSTDENIENFYTSLKYKLENGPTYDAILIGDDDALNFAVKYQAELFSGLPIVFFGINDKQRAINAAARPNMTGSIEAYVLLDNIMLARIQFFCFWI